MSVVSVYGNSWAIKPDFSGSPNRVLDSAQALPVPASSHWTKIWGELYKSAVFSTKLKGCALSNTAPLSFCFESETLPKVRTDTETSPTTKYLSVIESAFGTSASELSKILRVTRPMIYHYRRGMEPNPENFGRLKLIGSLVTEVGAGIRKSLQNVLKWEQPEGRSLMDMLSDPNMDVPVIRTVLRRISDDIVRRQNLAMLISNDKTEMKIIMESRHKDGKPIYVSDLQVDGQLIQIRPDGTRVPGRMVNRKFVPNGE